jgi:hypothetical protein
MAIVFLVFSFGERMELGGASLPLPYAWLQSLPVLGALRYPDRFFVMTLLGTAALAGFGCLFLRERWRVPRAAIGALVLLPLLEFWPGPLVGVKPGPDAPIPPWSAADPGAVIGVPTTFSNLDGEQMAAQAGHHRPIVGGYLMRRDPAQIRALQLVPALAPLLDPRPGALPGDLASLLQSAGVAYVCVQRAPWVPGEPDIRHDIVLPFSLVGRPFLRQRWFPDYSRHARLPQLAAQWESLLTPVLGAPVARTDGYALYRVAVP